MRGRHKRKRANREGHNETVHNPAVSGDNPNAKSQPENGGAMGSTDDPAQFLDKHWSEI